MTDTEATTMRPLHRLFIGAAYILSAAWASLIGYTIAARNVEGTLTAVALFVTVIAPLHWGAIDYAFKRAQGKYETRAPKEQA